MSEETTIKALNDAPARFGYLVAKSANQWIKEAAAKPIPRDLWKGIIYEGDLGIMFASSGLGKSILGTQIAHEVSQQMRILFFDCEMNDKQFQMRYEGFTFNENFIRMELSPDVDKPAGMSDEDFIVQNLEEAAISLNCHFIVVDNITYLRNDTEKAKDALSLMKKLKILKQKHGLTLLAISHTPKRDETRPLTANDLAGSKMLYNFCDTVFAIGIGNDPRVRYVKQLKPRYSENFYGDDNVMIYQIEKLSNGFLSFEFMTFGKEQDYLTPRNKDQRDQQVQALKVAGYGVNEIARQLNISNATVSRIIQKKNVTVNNR